MSANPNLVTFTPTPILVEISDIVISGTVVKRKALYRGMNYTEPPFETLPVNPFPVKDGVVLATRVMLYANNPDNSYGDRLSSRIFNDYDKSFSADADTLVNPVTGAIICEASKQFDPASFQEGGVLYNIKYMPENDFFHQLASNSPVIVRNVIAQYLVGINATNPERYNP